MILQVLGLSSQWIFAPSFDYRWLIHAFSELSKGRVDPRVGSGHDFAEFWWVKTS